MKKHFITGLVIILPLVLTLIILSFLLELLTKPFEGVALSILGHYQLLDKQFLFFNTTQVMILTSRLLVLFTLFGITLVIGSIARWVFVHEFLRLSDWLFHRIPLINTIYRASQETVTTIFSAESRTFKQVVLVPFPESPGLSIGLVTSRSIPDRSDENYKQMISVFIPGTPNPTVGFLLLYPPERVTPLDISVEEAMKLVISVGVMIPDNSAGKS